MLAERGAGDDPEAVLGEARHGEVALDSAAPVQHLRVGDRPTSRATLLSHRRSRNVGRVPPTTSIFANEVSSKSAAVVTAGAMLGADAGDQS